MGDSRRSLTVAAYWRCLPQLRKVGFDDAEIIEIVAHVMVVSLASSLYCLSDIAVDFPLVDLDEADR